MGRRYADELAVLADTYDYALSAEILAIVQSVGALRARPLVIVGSGGSGSAAQFSARLHEQHARLPARAMTPLEFLRYPVPQSAGVLLLSSSGRNRDILAAANHAIMSEYAPVVGLCTRQDTPLRRAVAHHRHCTIHEFVGPSRKDGFLATNSLLLTTSILARAYGVALPVSLPSLAAQADALMPERLITQAEARASILALASDWAVPAAVDLESKWSEIGFGTVTVTDPRNFAHGRHHGLARRIRETLVLGLAVGKGSDILSSTLAKLPGQAHKGLITSPLDQEAGALDLLVRVMILAGSVGGKAGIDIGQPRVPAFGRALYRTSPIARRGSRTAFSSGTDPRDLWIRRKVSNAVWEGASESARGLWRAQCQEWVAAAEAERIEGVVFDYDGTLCEDYERFGAPAAVVGLALARLLGAGVTIGIATGRGDSVLTALRQVVPQSYWSGVVVGMYNGSCICRLNETPTLENSVRAEIQSARQAIERSAQLAELITVRERPTQLTLHSARPLPEGLLRRMVLEALGPQGGPPAVQVMASGHTVDLLASGLSKSRVVDAVRASCQAARGAQSSSDGPYVTVMTIGDQGQLGGNDATFLAHTLGLSVENVSSVFSECWNVAPAGLRRTAALLNYLDALQVGGNRVCQWSVAAASRSRQTVRSQKRMLSSGRAV